MIVTKTLIDFALFHFLNVLNLNFLLLQLLVIINSIWLSRLGKILLITIIIWGKNAWLIRCSLRPRSSSLLKSLLFWNYPVHNCVFCFLHTYSSILVVLTKALHSRLIWWLILDRTLSTNLDFAFNFSAIKFNVLALLCCLILSLITVLVLKILKQSVKTFQRIFFDNLMCSCNFFNLWLTLFCDEKFYLPFWKFLALSYLLKILLSKDFINPREVTF